jgi:hypothetical protein
MTGLTELIGLVCLFILAPVIAWQLWFRSDGPVGVAAPSPRPVLFDYDAHQASATPPHQRAG